MPHPRLTPLCIPISLFLVVFITMPAFATDWVEIPEGKFIMGDAKGDANEAPKAASVDTFSMMRHEVTNREFTAFVSQTNYITDVERNREGHVWTTRWKRDQSATYRTPNGSETSIEGLENHPVVQVSGRDAAAYCAHYGARLPTETEWEFAARGHDERRYPWGNQKPEQKRDQVYANFGTDGCCAASDADGFSRTAPVGSYPAGDSPFGVQDMAGNVWEWTSTAFPGKPAHRVIRGGGWGNNAYCLRASYRHGNPPDIGLSMVGFRCVK